MSDNMDLKQWMIGMLVISTILGLGIIFAMLS